MIVIITFNTNFRSLDLQIFRFQSRERDRHRNYHLRFYIPRAVSNSRTFFVFTRTRKERGTVFIINGYTANVKKKKRKENNSNISKMFRLPARVKLDRFNYNLSIVFDYTPLREKDTNKPFLNFYFPFLSLIFNFSSPPLESNYLLYRKKKVLYTRSTREDIIKHEEGSPSNQEKSIPILGVQIKSCSKRSRSPRRSLKSSSEIRSSPPFPLASGFVRCRARASKLICRDERQQKR